MTADYSAADSRTAVSGYPAGNGRAGLATFFAISNRKQVLGAGLLVLLVATLIAVWHLHHNDGAWDSDGAIYLRMTMQARGVPADSARQDANRFMLAKIERMGPERSDRGLYSENPPNFYVEQFALFRNRPLYPLLCALLYPALGPVALKVVSSIAYVCAVGVMFALLLLMTSPVRAAVGALVFATEQVTLNLAALPLTDELALLFWTCALFAVVAYQRRPAGLALLGICLASILLTLTRPAFFLPLGAAAGAFEMLRRSYGLRAAIAPLLAAAPAAIVYFLYTAVAHGPTAISQLHWQYSWQHAVHGFGADHGPVLWYLGALYMEAYSAAVRAVPELGGILLVLLALVGARSFRTSGPARVALFSAAAVCTAIFVNPLGVERPVLMPMAPLVIVLAVAGAQRLELRKLPSEAS